MIILKKVIFAGDRLFMKYGNLKYFTSRLTEVGAETVATEGTTDKELIEAAEDAAAVVVIARRISRELMERAKKLEFIMTLSVGYDCVDLDAATELGIQVSNCPVYCTDDVANHAMTLLLAVSRKLHMTIPGVKAGDFTYGYTKPILNYRGKKLGIIGLGRIGRTIVPKARGFGMNIAAYDPYVDDDIFEMLGVERKYELKDLVTDADFFTVHALLTPETRGIIGLQEFKNMKSHAVIINTARGPIIDEEALATALEQDMIAGAGIDVFSVEPPPSDHPLIRSPKTIVTPHIAWYSEESFEANKVLGMDELTGVLSGLRPRYIVNPGIYGTTYKRLS
jgi:D-3-phosphoglycerate dehydrogenase / 2-oxoglutarate reductase